MGKRSGWCFSRFNGRVAAGDSLGVVISAPVGDSVSASVGTLVCTLVSDSVSVLVGDSVSAPVGTLVGALVSDSVSVLVGGQ